MTMNLDSSKLAVCLSDETVLRLFKLRRCNSETLDSVVSRLATTKPCSPTQERGFTSRKLEVCRDLPSMAAQKPKLKYKYKLAFLGEELGANTLGELFGEFVDALQHVAPDAVEKLATLRSRKRAFLSRERGSIHPGRPDLKTIRTATGWWISANVGRADLHRALLASCVASGLAIDEDIRFIR